MKNKQRRWFYRCWVDSGAGRDIFGGVVVDNATPFCWDNRRTKQRPRPLNLVKREEKKLRLRWCAIFSFYLVRFHKRATIASACRWATDTCTSHHCTPPRVTKVIGAFFGWEDRACRKIAIVINYIIQPRSIPIPLTLTLQCGRCRRSN